MARNRYLQELDELDRSDTLVDSASVGDDPPKKGISKKFRNRYLEELDEIAPERTLSGTRDRSDTLVEAGGGEEASRRMRDFAVGGLKGTVQSVIPRAMAQVADFIGNSTGRIRKGTDEFFAENDPEYLATLKPYKPGVVSRAFQGIAEEGYRVADEGMARGLEGTGSEQAGRVAAEFVGEGAKYMYGGTKIRAAAGLPVKAITGLRGVVPEALKDAVAVLPFDVGTSQRPEDSSAAGMAHLLPEEGKLAWLQKLAEEASKTEEGRLAFESSFGLAADVALRGGIGVLHHIRGLDNAGAAINPLAQRDGVAGEAGHVIGPGGDDLAVRKRAKAEADADELVELAAEGARGSRPIEGEEWEGIQRVFRKQMMQGDPPPGNIPKVRLTDAERAGVAVEGPFGDMDTLREFGESEVGVPWRAEKRDDGYYLIAGDAPRDLPMDEASRMARAEEQGYTTDAFHGTNRDFSEFGGTYGNPESHYGAHHYFTDSADDVNTNYASDAGPDMSQRIEMEMERLADDYEVDEGVLDYWRDKGLDVNDIDDLTETQAEEAGRAIAKDRLGIEHGGAVIPARLRMKKPVTVGGADETRWEYTSEFDEAGDFVSEGGEAVDLIEHTRDALDGWGVHGPEADDVMNDLIEALGEGEITASRFDAAIRDNVTDLYDEMSGEMASPGALISDIWQRMGHDGINMDAETFSWRAGFGNTKIPNMAGTEGARHYIVFDPSNIRGRFAKFDPANEGKADLLGGAVGDVPRAIARTGIGATAGAAVDEENRLRGAVVGGAAAAGAPAAVKGLKGLDRAGAVPNPRRLSGQVDTGMPGVWYSRLQRAVEKGPGKATGAEWDRFLNPSKRGFGESEAEWTGIRSWLQENADTKLSRDDVLGFARDKGVRLEENLRGGGVDKETLEALDAEWAPANERRRAAADALGNDIGQYGLGNGTTFADRSRQVNGDYPKLAHRSDTGELRFTEEATPDQRRRIQEYVDAGAEVSAIDRRRDALSMGQRTRFSEYKQPGGENYREVLVKMDDFATNRLKAAQDERHALQAKGAAQTEEDLARVRDLYKIERDLMLEDSGRFRSSHWPDDPNTLVHLRTTDRTINGEKTLFIEEIQSDWHQQGRERGYRGTDYKPEDAVVEAWSPSAWRITFPGRDYIGVSRRLFPNEADAVAEAARQINYAGGPGVPDAPYKKTDEWVGLAVRRALQEAVDGGYERIAWASGEQSADLYDLRKQVSRIQWDEGEGRLRAYGHDGEQVLNQSGVTADNLADYIGKEPAKRLIEAEPPQPSWAPERYVQSREISGDDLAIGGEGMDEFYNRIVPKVVQKEARALGLKVDVEPVSIRAEETGMSGLPLRNSLPLPDGWYTEIEAGGVSLFSPDGIWMGNRPNQGAVVMDMAEANTEFRHAVQDLVDAGPSEPTNLSIRITPETRAKVRSEGTRLGAALPEATGAVARTLAGSAVGGAVGASVDEDKGRGALLGAGLGAVSSGSWAIKALRNTPDVSLPRTGLKGTPEGPVQLPPSQKALKQAEEVNIKNFALDASGKERMARHVARLMDIDPGLNKVVTWDETRHVATNLGLSPQDLDKVAAGRMTGAELLAMRDLISQNLDDIQRMQNLARMGVNQDGTLMSAGELERSNRLINSLGAQNDRYLNRFLRARSEAGRKLNSLKIVANRTLDPVTWEAQALKIKGSPLSEAEHAKLRSLLNAGDRVALTRFVGSLYEAPMSEKLVTLWKAGLLTNPTTHAANVIGNIGMGTMELAKDAPAAFFDRLASTISDVRSKGGVSARTVKASWDAAMGGVPDAVDVIKTGELTDADILAKYDIMRQVDFDNWLGSAFLNAYAGPRSRIFASLQAGDKIFKQSALARSMMEQAELIAKQEGLVGAALDGRIDELLNTDSALHSRAIVDAEVATFLNKGSHTTIPGVDLAEAGEGLRRNLGTAGQIVMPFTRTPANIMDRVLEYSPVGFMADLPKFADWIAAVRKGKKGSLSVEDLAELQALQREMVEQAGRATIGTAVIVAGYALAEKGILSGNYPSEPAERSAIQLTNEQPHSLKVDGHWLSLDRISPVGNLLTLGAEMHNMAQSGREEGLSKPESLKGMLVASPAVVGKTVVEQSFLRGVQGALDAIVDPERSAARWVRQTAASAIPSGVYAVTRATDPVMRDPQTVSEAVQSRLPGLSGGVAPKVDAFGQDRVRDTSLLGRAGQVFNPFTMREDLADDDTGDEPIRREVARVGANVTTYYPRRLKVQGEYVDPPARGTGDYTGVQREYGTAVRDALAEVIGTLKYKTADDEEKKQMLEDAESAAKRKTTAGRKLKLSGN